MQLCWRHNQATGRCIPALYMKSAARAISHEATITISAGYSLEHVWHSMCIQMNAAKPMTRVHFASHESDAPDYYVLRYHGG